MRMKNAFKYIVGIFFTCYGAYFGFHSVYVLKKLFNVYSYIIKVQYGIGNSMFLLNLFLNSIMSIFELTHSITCLMIGMSRKRWKFVLICGILGSILYLCSILDVVFFFENADLSTYLHIVLFMLFPISIIAFAVYYKKQEQHNMEVAYYPITMLAQTVASICNKVKRNIKLHKISWKGHNDSEE